MIFGKIKMDTSVQLPHVITEERKQGKIDIIRAIKGTHKYNTRSSTNRVEHVTTFKIIPNIFKIHAEEKISTHKL